MCFEEMREYMTISHMLSFPLDIRYTDNKEFSDLVAKIDETLGGDQLGTLYFATAYVYGYYAVYYCNAILFSYENATRQSVKCN